MDSCFTPSFISAEFSENRRLLQQDQKVTSVGCKGRFRFKSFVSVFQGSMDVESQSSPVIEMHSKINDSIKYEHLFSEKLAIRLLMYIPGEIKVMYTHVLFNNWGKSTVGALESS